MHAPKFRPNNPHPRRPKYGQAVPIIWLRKETTEDSLLGELIDVVKNQGNEEVQLMMVSAGKRDMLRDVLETFENDVMPNRNFSVRMDEQYHNISH